MFIKIKPEMFMMVNFLMVIGMELEQWTMRMEINMKDHGKMESGMDLESIHGQLMMIKSKTTMMENG